MPVFKKLKSTFKKTQVEYWQKNSWLWRQLWISRKNSIIFNKYLLKSISIINTDEYSTYLDRVLVEGVAVETLVVLTLFAPWIPAAWQGRAAVLTQCQVCSQNATTRFWFVNNFTFYEGRFSKSKVAA